MTQRILEAAELELHFLGYKTAEIIGDGIWIDVWDDILSDTKSMRLHDEEVNHLAEEHDMRIYLEESRLKKQKEQQNKEEKIKRYVEAVLKSMHYTEMYEYAYSTMLYGLEHSTTDEEFDKLYNEYFEDNDE